VSTENSIGSSAILRLSGLPIQFWLAASNEHLFSLVARLHNLQNEYASLSKSLAERIGTELAPHRSLCTKDRAFLLDVRRRLHNALPVRDSAWQRSADLAHHLLCEPDRLIDSLTTTATLAQEITILQTRISQIVIYERARLTKIAVELASSTPLIKVLLRDRNPGFYSEVEDRVRRGASWESKSLRRRGDYLWKIIDRASTKSTPRDWHGHVALLSVSPGTTALVPIDMTEDIAAFWCENIHLQRQTLSSLPLKEANSKARLAITPLHWASNEELQFWVVNLDNPTRMVEMQMRRTALLDAVYTALVPGPKTIDEYEAEILSASDEEQRELIRKFTERLISLGVIQVSSTPRSHLALWHRFDQEGMGNWCRPTRECPSSEVALRATSSSVANMQKEGYLDIYRQTKTSLPLYSCIRFQQLFEQAQRVFAVIELDRLSGSAGTRLMTGSRPQPLLELIRDRMDAITGISNDISDDEISNDIFDDEPRRPSQPTSRDSSYSRLLQFISSRVEESETIDLSQSLLDDLGAPDAQIDWPIDCVLRVPAPGSGYQAVLEEAFPAGSLDARFITVMQSLYGPVYHSDGYRQFLECIERQSGIMFLELLVPPLAVDAANAVRRPVHTRAWTGDPDIGTYCDIVGTMPRYVPLSAIWLRRVGGRLLAEVDGCPVCPMYHSTRTPIAPWNFVVEILLAAAPLPMRWSPRRLQYALSVFPDRQFMPRITVAGQLVLTCAQWRLPCDGIWDSKSTPLTKVRALERLRYRWRLPRWVYVSAGTGSKPAPCDLESVRAIQALERAAKAASTHIRIIEMLPAPDQLLVFDHAIRGNERSASAIMLRVPCDESPTAMGVRVAPLFSRFMQEAAAKNPNFDPS
jgi:Lantibiotic dehydratase, N terminus